MGRWNKLWVVLVLVGLEKKEVSSVSKPAVALRRKETYCFPTLRLISTQNEGKFFWPSGRTMFGWSNFTFNPYWVVRMYCTGEENVTETIFTLDPLSRNTPRNSN